jgi:sugar lactone lactonase YvrE
MKGFLFVCIVFFSGTFFLRGQTFPFQLLKTLPGDFSDMAVDALGNTYLITTGGQLRKAGADGTMVAVFNEVRKYGKLYAIDVSNPLKTLLFYRDFGTVVVLDRFLNIRNVMDLRQTGLYQVKCLAQAYDNGYWIFDEQEGRVKHINESGSVKDQFTDFRLLFDTMPSPQSMIDQQKQLYLYDTARGVYIFDYYGTFRQRLPYRGWKDFFVINSMLFGRDDRYLYRYDTRTMREQIFPLLISMREAIRVRFNADAVYVLHPNRLEIYRVVQE